MSKGRTSPVNGAFTAVLVPGMIGCGAGERLSSATRESSVTALRASAAAVVSSAVALLCEIATGKIAAIMINPMPSTTTAKRTSGNE